MEPARAVAIVREVAPLLDSAAAEGRIREVTAADVLLPGDGVRLADSAQAPHRAAGDRPDVPALARLLAECLTGRPTGPGEATPPSVVRPGVPAAFDEVVRRGLDPVRHHATCGELAAAAEAALPDGAVRTPAAGAGRPGRLPLLLGAVAVLAVLAVVLVLVLSGGSDDAPAGPAAPGPGSSQPGGTATLAADETDDPVQAQLRASIPDDWIDVDCDTGVLPDDGAIAALGCGAARNQPGPEDSVFYRYPDAATLDAVFQADMQRNGVGPLPEGAQCPSAHGYGTYEIDGQPAGRIACYVDADNNGILIWTRDAVATEAIVTVMDGGQIGLDVLYDWWSVQEQSDFILP